MSDLDDPSHPAHAILDRAAQLGRELRARGLLLVTAESCTAGGIAYAVTSVPGSSAWYDCGFVTYSDDAKRRLLSVPARLLRGFGAVSEPVAAAMARGALAASTANIAVAVTGIAGPDGGTPDKPVGTVCISWAQRAPGLKRPAVDVVTRRFAGDRNEVRSQTIIAALDGLIERALRAPGDAAAGPSA